MATACAADVVASSLGIAGEWTVHNGETQTDVEKIAVKEGDTVDFITDCREHVTSDSFTWRVEVTLTDKDGRRDRHFARTRDFTAPCRSRPLWKSRASSRAWQLAYSRLPTRDELQSACEFLTSQRQYLRVHPQHTSAGRSPETQALANLCHALLSSNEFLYVD